MFTGHGKLHYHTNWLMLYTDDEIGKYYRALLRSQEPWLKLNIPMHGMHVTVVPGKYENPPKKDEYWGLYENEIVSFTYDGVVSHWHDYYYGMRIYSSRIEDIREELGLPRILPVFWHVTIANTKGLGLDED
jgi:hypothetical protein